jgi:hypothetical protein
VRSGELIGRERRVGPSGEVDPDGGIVYTAGEVRLTGDPDTGLVTSFTVHGTLTDVCGDLTG